LVERERILEETNQQHDYIFVTRDGNPASSDRLRDWIGSWSDVVEQPCYPHSFRHYQISLLKRLEIDDELIVYLTGWSESTGHSMIAIYNDNELKDSKFACLNRLKTALENNQI
jgi:integrase